MGILLIMGSNLLFLSLVRMYWELGRKIVEEEQHGKERAEYGDFLLKKIYIINPH